jgi:putative endonuclease
MKTLYLYILRCSDESFYTGVTNDMDRRLWEHQQGVDEDAYTYSRRPVEVVFLDEFPDPTQAIEAEKRVKSWSLAKKQALIDGN